MLVWLQPCAVAVCDASLWFGLAVGPNILGLTVGPVFAVGFLVVGPCWAV